MPAGRRRRDETATSHGAGGRLTPLEQLEQMGPLGPASEAFSIWLVDRWMAGDWPPAERSGGAGDPDVQPSPAPPG